MRRARRLVWHGETLAAADHALTLAIGNDERGLGLWMDATEPTTLILAVQSASRTVLRNAGGVDFTRGERTCSIAVAKGTHSLRIDREDRQ